ncbi:MAG: DUF4192 family protein [Nocardioides sp.]
MPHLLGFVPEDSVVCVPLGGVPVARLDLPHDDEDIGAAVGCPVPTRPPRRRGAVSDPGGERPASRYGAASWVTSRCPWCSGWTTTPGPI